MRLLLVFLMIECGASALDLRYWIEPCTDPATKCQAHDPQMAEWAMQDWQRGSEGQLHLEKTTQRLRANIRIHWASADGGLYGEARRFEEDGLVGYDVYVLPDLSASAPEIASATAKDALLRDAIVYLTCLHETGHALRLAHTDVFADIMYSFQFGGDIPEYFGRYRRKLTKREDVAKTSGTSSNDRVRLLQMLKAR
jgi:predicted Zn-dependent protease